MKIDCRMYCKHVSIKQLNNLWLKKKMRSVFFWLSFPKVLVDTSAKLFINIKSPLVAVPG